MTDLLSLPTELLEQILWHVGGRELRRGPAVGRLTISRRWYGVAQPVFLSGLDTRKVCLFGHNISDLDELYGMRNGRRQLMHRNTRILRVRLLGHWWDQGSANNLFGRDPRANDDGDSDYAFEEAVEPPDSLPECDFHSAQGARELDTWQAQELVPRLDALFADLPNFGVLERLTFEASVDADDERGPRGAYIPRAAVRSMLHSLPLTHDLNLLTLDLCSGLRDSDVAGESQQHLCPDVAQVVLQIPHVRLRLQRMCPTVFPRTALETDGNAIEPRLRSLVIKLHIPYFVGTNNNATEPCHEMSGSRSAERLVSRMVRAGQQFLAFLASARGHSYSGLSEHGDC